MSLPRRKVLLWTVEGWIEMKFWIFVRLAIERLSQSQSYFMTGDSPPISSSWHKYPWGSRPEIFFKLGHCGHSSYVTSSLTRRWLFSYEYAWPFVKCTARGSVVGWGTMLQTGRSRVRIPMRSLDFSIYLILPAALWTLGSTQPLTGMSTRYIPGGTGAAGV
jgi:hypothetical protein